MRSRKGFFAVAGAVALSAGLSACGSGPTSGNSVPETSTSTPPSSISAAIALDRAGNTAVYKATYSVVARLFENRSPATLVVEQNPPRLAVSSGGVTVFTSSRNLDSSGSDYSKAIVCSTKPSQPETCSASSGGLSEPIGIDNVDFLVRRQSALVALKSMAQFAGRPQFEAVTGSTRTVADQPSKCVTGTPPAKTLPPSTYCFNDSGVLTYSATPLGTVTLLSYEPSAPASDLESPPAASVATSP